VIDCILRDADAKHGIKNSFLRKPITDEEDLAVEAYLQAVDVLPSPQARHTIGVPM
jgi:hypothetical protein